jgi:hypothetical protein
MPTMHLKNILLFSALIILLVLPLFSFAGFAAPPGDDGIKLSDLEGIFLKFIRYLWMFFAGFATVMFLIAGFSYLTARGDGTKITNANRAVIFGFVGIAVAILAYSVISIVMSFLI